MPLISGALRETELIQAAYLNHHFPLHAHPQYVIGFVASGTKKSRHRGRDIVVPPGTAMLLNPFEEHTTRGVGGRWTYTAIYPTNDVITEYLDEYAAKFSFNYPLVRDDRLNGTILGLYATVLNRSPALNVQTKFSDLLSLLQARTGQDRLYSESDASTAKVMREILDSNIGVDITLADVASCVALPRLTALRTFRRHVGCTPHVYRQTRRIDAAKLRLRRGEGVATVASETGFCDQSHFSRTFKQWVGMTPRAFARADAVSVD